MFLAAASLLYAGAVLAGPPVLPPNSVEIRAGKSLVASHAHALPTPNDPCYAAAVESKLGLRDTDGFYLMPVYAVPSPATRKPVTVAS